LGFRADLNSADRPARDRERRKKPGPKHRMQQATLHMRIGKIITTARKKSLAVSCRFVQIFPHRVQTGRSGYAQAWQPGFF